MFSVNNVEQTNVTIFLIVLVVAILLLFLTRRLLKISFPYFFMGLLGIIIGLLIGSQVAIPLSKLPGPYGTWVPMIVDVFITVATLDLFIAQAKPAADFFHKIMSKIFGTTQDICENQIVVDTSSLIDGRLEQIAQSGFILGKILIPQFVLAELQNIADSDDSIRRAKGRRGMESLDKMQNSSKITVEIIDDFEGGKEPVDLRLIKVAKKRKAKIITVDYNLNRIAKIQNVEVLNVNELAESLKPSLIPGEEILVKIIQKGKEAGQGVGYLPDGTMIVVEGGENLVGKEIRSEVVRIYHTVAGKMIFVQPRRPLRHQLKN
ncbi:MAG: PilT protein domain protein [Berkelbacteria bacterium GW2011_GWA1_36_9]|uniref:PilT protein domain protein n=1 Tax=Berkelbacteria bacterium GW2011_GWA1_36_9 TaxID=1618331 RepID=A0A0G0I3I9_9BACT|nr:MAG: PilT protein domain protein [Berkelbacteria bacterium GW2011_GWA1_36_9]